MLGNVHFLKTYIYFQDHKKTKSLQAFFSSLTHELKTPLASIKLQTQVLDDFISEGNFPDKDKEKISKYTKRLLSDAVRLEDQLDNHLQLSRVERKALLSLSSINICTFLDKETKRYNESIEFEILNSTNTPIYIHADDFALRTILRNLIDNSIKHVKSTPIKAEFKIIPHSSHVKIYYQDNGDFFCGQVSHLGRLFYKHNSPKGSGIGIYLIKSLMEKMGGLFEIKQSKNLQTILTFKAAPRKEYNRGDL